MKWDLIETRLFYLIEKVILKVLNDTQEEWVTAKELSERIPIFTETFLKKHGEVLPREKMEYIEDGKIIESRYMYPLHSINLMVKKGVFRSAEMTMNAHKYYKKVV